MVGVSGLQLSEQTLGPKPPRRRLGGRAPPPLTAVSESVVAWGCEGVGVWWRGGVVAWRRGGAMAWGRGGRGRRSVKRVAKNLRVRTDMRLILPKFCIQLD